MRRSLAVLALSVSAFGSDSPSKVQSWHEVEAKVEVRSGPKFFQFRKGPDAPTFSNRNVLHSKAFWIQAAFMFSAEELARTRTHSESEPWAAAGVMGFSYLGYRFFSPCFTLGMTGSGAHWLREWAKK